MEREICKKIYVVVGPIGPTGPPGSDEPSNIFVTQTAFIDGEYGNNATGQVDNLSRPFQTIDPVIFTDPASNLEIILRPGNYVLPPVNVSSHSSITFLGAGIGITTLQMSNVTGPNTMLYFRSLTLLAGEDERIVFNQNVNMNNVHIRSPVNSATGSAVIMNSNLTISSATFALLEGDILLKNSIAHVLNSTNEQVANGVRFNSVLLEEIFYSNTIGSATIPAFLNCFFDDCHITGAELGEANTFMSGCTYTGGSISNVNAQTELQRSPGQMFINCTISGVTLDQLHTADSAPSTTDGVTRPGGTMFSACILTNSFLDNLSTGNSGGVAPGTVLPATGTNGGLMFALSTLSNCVIGNAINSEFTVITGRGADGGIGGRGGVGGPLLANSSTVTCTIHGIRVGDGGLEGGNGGSFMSGGVLSNTSVNNVQTGNGQDMTVFNAGATSSGMGGSISNASIFNSTFANITLGNGGSINIPDTEPITDLGALTIGDGGYFLNNGTTENTDIRNLTTGNGGDLLSIPLAYPSTIRLGEGGSVFVDNTGNANSNLRINQLSLNNITTGRGGDNNTGFVTIDVSGGTLIDRITSIDIRFMNVTLGRGSDVGGTFSNPGLLIRGYGDANIPRNMESLTFLGVEYPADRPNPTYSIINSVGLILVRLFVDWGSPAPANVSPAPISLDINFTKWIGANPVIVPNNPGAGIFNQT